MRAPEFWWQKRPSLIARLLFPIGAIYGWITARRMAGVATGAASTAKQTVICIGNFTAGGTGKTPVAIAIAKLLQGEQRSLCFLSRGYGGGAISPLLVDAELHDATLVGDEPLLLARVASTIVSRDRAAALPLCAATGADVILMDDGLQNSGLRKNLSIAVIDGKVGIGNGLCIPAGPLRAPLARQWPFVDAVIIMGEGEAGQSLAKEAASRGIAVFFARLQAKPASVARLSGQSVLAYCGIGRPQKFFDQVRLAGVQKIVQHPFADHHFFSEAEADALVAKASEQNLTLLTTEKDLARLGRPEPGSELANLVEASLVLPVEAVFEQSDDLKRFLQDRVV